jgi:hypothetical protein
MLERESREKEEQSREKEEQSRSNLGRKIELVTNCLITE